MAMLRRKHTALGLDLDAVLMSGSVELEVKCDDLLSMTGAHTS